MEIFPPVSLMIGMLITSIIAQILAKSAGFGTVGAFWIGVCAVNVPVYSTTTYKQYKYECAFARME